MTWRPTLRQVFGLSLLGLLLGLGLLFYLVMHGSMQTLLQSAERYRRLASRDVVARQVTTYLNEAPMAVTNFEQQVHYGLIDPKSLDSVEQGLLSLLLANQNISEATLTYADNKGYDHDGYIQTDPASSGQVTVLLSAQPGQFVCKRTWYNGTRFVSQSTVLSQSTSAKPASAPLPDMDPTRFPTFQTASRKDLSGQSIWTDLHWSQIDETLPQLQRRVEVSVQKTITDSQGHFVGVLRVGLMKTQIDNAVKLHITSPGEKDPHLIFLCDNQGRLITGFGDRDHVTVSGDDLRIAPKNVPPVVAQALQQPILKSIDDSQPEAATSFRFENMIYLCTFKSMPQTQDWIVGIVVPQNFYLSELQRIQEKIMWAASGLMLAVIWASWLISRSVVRAQSLILRETSKMNKFEFVPAAHSSYLRDVQDVLGGLERAKTAMRAMSKYVPVKLVRQLYHEGQEPMLGGQIAELSVLFTDIKDFTSISEQTPPDQLAEILGRYLQVMAGIIQQEKGTIDKYIGDAVMAFWNAPEPVADHEILACRAALRGREGLRQLYASSAWGTAPRFETRLGLHRCQASVGHFGAPDRFNYTAIGDGINLTSRLEGLNKYYGTTIIASDAIYLAAKEHFEFRLLDRVAVKGKTQGLTIYELLSERTPGNPRPNFVETYEQAFALYQHADFSAALALLEKHPEDNPSQVLAQRCRELTARTPSDWNGLHIFDSK